MYRVYLFWLNKQPNIHFLPTEIILDYHYQYHDQVSDSNRNLSGWYVVSKSIQVEMSAVRNFEFDSYL